MVTQYDRNLIRKARLSPPVAFIVSAIAFVFTVSSAQIQPKQPVTEPSDSAEIRVQIAHIQKLLPNLPDRAAALYILAVLTQKLGQTHEALKFLEQCAALHEGFDPAGSPTLRTLKGSSEFDQLVAMVHQEFPVVTASRLAFVANEKDLVPEGLAYDAKQDVFYLSSLNRRKIVRITPGGIASNFSSSSHDNLLPILGIRTDSTDGSVWAASWSEASEKSELLHFNPSGQLLNRFSPGDSLQHGFNDLVVRKNGDVLLTDSLSNQVLLFKRGTATFTPLPVHRELSGPNGIALAGDDRQLFVADDYGVIHLNLERGISTELNRGPNSTLSGIDGLYWHNGSLIAIQNSIGSPRVVAFKLSKDTTSVEQTTVLENRTNFTIEPTTGAIRGDVFYFIANSQGPNVNEDRIVDPGKLEPVRIARVHLPS